ncbi:hypothetical protein A9Q88_02395 [Gammaproteobacteria bacterium 50_400_T64]|nr:hypothetical protein A9Q88_02395 [Gammaproteobacteria bacterium 50_400_T64]
MKASSLRQLAIFIVLSGFSSLSTADLFGDLKNASDLIKRAGEMLPTSRAAPREPSHPNQEQPDATPRKEEVLPANSHEGGDISSNYFDSLGFDVGEIATIEPLDKTTFKTLYVPSYKGIPRIGLMPKYSQVNVARHIKDDATKRLRNDMWIYHSLRLLAVMDEHVTDEALEAVAVSAKPYSVRGKTRSFEKYALFNYTPSYHIAGLVSAMLPKTLDLYFCDTNKCSYPNGFNPSNNGGWGGINANEFKARRAYNDYMKTETPKLKAWAKSLSPDVYIVGRIQLGNYDFKKKGFSLQLVFPKEGLLNPRYAPRNREERVFGDFIDGKLVAGQSFFISLDAEKAEALQHKTKIANASMSMLYFTVKGQVHNAAAPTGNRGRSNRVRGGVALALEVTGSTVEFFSDELLTNKLFEAAIK